MGDRLFAIPWSAFRVDTEQQCLVLNLNSGLLKSAPGFDKDNWPDFADQAWGVTIYNYYRAKPYWH